MKRTFSLFSMTVVLFAGSLLAPMLLVAQNHAGSPLTNPDGTGKQNGMSPYMKSNGPEAPQNNVPFIQQHTSDGIRQNMATEIQFSQLALKRSKSSEIKKFAKQVIAENRVIAQGARQFAPDKTGTFPSAMFAGTRQYVDAGKAEKKMKTVTGPAFDRIYLVQMNNFAESDQQIGHATYAMMNLPGGVSAVGRKMWDMANARVKQIAVLARELDVNLSANIADRK